MIGGGADISCRRRLNVDKMATYRQLTLSGFCGRLGTTSGVTNSREGDRDTGEKVQQVVKKLREDDGDRRDKTMMLCY